MEENKYICPKCGTEMSVVYEKPALNLTCPHCGCKIATSKWEEIDLDDTLYQIIISPIKDPDIETIKFVSNFTGMNFLKSKKFLVNGGILFEDHAVEILKKRKLFDDNLPNYSITPFFKY